MTALELKNVKFAYPNGFEALHGINLKIGQGEKVAIIGENGAGKTTMAKMTNGLLRPTSGEVLVGEQPTVNKTVAAISRHVGYVFQNPDDQICNQSIFKEVSYTLRYNKTYPPCGATSFLRNSDKIYEKKEMLLRRKSKLKHPQLSIWIAGDFFAQIHL